MKGALSPIERAKDCHHDRNRLERKGPFPGSIVVVDLDGLKYVNDQLGHSGGDALLRRLGEVLSELVEKPNHAARIGGDEFAVLMPGADDSTINIIRDSNSASRSAR